MKKKKVIKTLKNELVQAKNLLAIENMEKEYYDTLKEYKKIMKIALKAVKKYRG